MFKSNESKDYRCYELNMVRNDGNRFPLIVHSCLKTPKKDGLLLSEKLNIPFWDISKDEKE